jgi:hypothetical protein
MSLAALNHDAAETFRRESNLTEFIKAVLDH